MRKLTLGLTAVAVGALLAAVLTRPLAGVFSTDYAVWAGCPLETGELGAPPPGSYGQAGTLRVDALDPWGQPYRFVVRGPGVEFYACGPDGVDDGGPGAGDDVAVLSRQSFTVVADTPWTCGLLALLSGWLAVLSHVWGKPRSPRAEVEALRAGLLALLPAALAGWGVFRHPRLLEPLEPLARGLLVPLPAAVTAGLTFALFLVALRLRLTRPAPPDVEETRPRWGRILSVALVLVSLSALLAGWGQARHQRWRRVRLLAQAQVGVGSAIKRILKFGDAEQAQAFLRTAPSWYDFAEQGDAELRRLAQLGPPALPLFLSVLDDDESPRDTMPSVAVEFVLTHDPELQALAPALADDPARFSVAINHFADRLLPRWGRRALITRLLPLLDDRSQLPTRWNDYQPRVCDRAAQGLIGLTLDDCPVRAPSVIEGTPTAADWDAAIAAFDAWWTTGPPLTPACWIDVELSALPATPARPLRVETRFELGAQGSLESATQVEHPTHWILQRLRAQPCELVVSAAGRTRIRIPLDPPARDSTLRVRADWGAPDAYQLTVLEHPR